MMHWHSKRDTARQAAADVEDDEHSDYLTAWLQAVWWPGMAASLTSAGPRTGSRPPRSTAFSLTSARQVRWSSGDCAHGCARTAVPRLK